LDKKMDRAMETGANKLVTCCPSCMMQLNFGARRHHWNAEVVHIVDLLSPFYKVLPKKAASQ